MDDVEATAAQRLHCRGLEGLIFRHGWQNAGKTGRQHGFSGSWRACHKDTVASRRRDLQRPPCLNLPPYLFHVEI